MSELIPTGEQQATLDAFTAGGSIALHAGAGTGKTSTLKLLTRANPSARFLYLAYNRAIAQESKTTFPRNARCSTAHAYALGRLRSNRNSAAEPVLERLQAPRIRSRDLAQWLKINKGIRVNDLAVLHPGTQARIAKDMVLRWCHSDDPEITSRHLPAVPGIDDHAQRREIGDILLPFAQRIWADATNPAGKLRTEHDHYLKLFSLAGGRWNTDVILLDEAQDSNPCVAGMIIRQHQEGARIVAVGDSAQAIYGWRGAVDAMDKFPADHRIHLTQSFRFGPEVAAEANKWLTMLQSPLRLTGTPSIDSQVTDIDSTAPDAVLCRTNAEAMRHVLQAHRDQVPVAIVGGGTDLKSFAKAAIDLQTRQSTSHPELCSFPSWAAVQEYVDSDGGTDLKTFVRLIDDHGPEAVIDAVDRAVPEDRANVIVSTAHRSKGREWDTVQVGDDFPVPTEKRPVGEEEARLAYVTVTRARHILHRGSLDWIDEHPDGRTDTPATPRAGSHADTSVHITVGPITRSDSAEQLLDRLFAGDCTLDGATVQAIPAATDPAGEPPAANPASFQPVAEVIADAVVEDGGHDDSPVDTGAVDGSAQPAAAAAAPAGEDSLDPPDGPTLGIDPYHWQQITQRFDSDDDAAMWLTDAFHTFLDTVLQHPDLNEHDLNEHDLNEPSLNEPELAEPAAPHAQPASEPALELGRGRGRTVGQNQPPAGRPAGEDDDLPDYYRVANNTLGVALADKIRGQIDAAIAAAAGQTPPADDPGALVEQALTAAGLTVYRRPNQTGYGIAINDHQIPGSGFGPGYSGPDILRRIQTRG